MSIADGVVNHCIPGEILVRDEIERPVRVDGHRTIRACSCRHRQLVAIRVAVIAEDVDVGQGNVARRGQHTVILGQGRIIQRIHVDDHGRCRRSALSVADRIGNRCRAVVIGIRHEIQGPVGIDAYRAVRTDCRDHRQRLPIWIVVVAEDIDVVQRRILIQRQRTIIGRQWRKIDRHGIDRHVDRRRACPAMAIADAVGYRRRPGEAGLRDKLQRAIRVDRHRTLRAAGRCHHQRITVHIGVIGQDIDCRQRRTGVGNQRPIDNGHRRIVDGGNIDRHGRICRATMTVADRVADRRCAIEIGGRHEIQRTVRVDCHRAARAAGRRDGQRITIHVAVITQHVDVIARRVFAERQRPVIDCNRRIIHGRDIDRDTGSRSTAVTIADRVADRRRAVEIERRGEFQGAIRVDRDRAIGAAGRCNGQRIAIHVAVVAQHVDIVQHRIFIGGQRPVVDSHRRIIDRHNVDVDGRRRRTAMAIADRVADRRCTIEIQVRHKIEGSVRIDADRPIRAGRGRDRQRIVVRVTVVAQHVDAVQGRIFIGNENTIIAGNGRVVTASNRDGQRTAGIAALAIRNGVGEALGRGIAGLHRDHGRIGRIEYVAIAAVFGHLQAAIVARQGRAKGRATADRARGTAGIAYPNHLDRIAVDIAILASTTESQAAGGHRCRNSHASRISHRQGIIVQASNRDGQRGETRHTLIIGHGIGEDIGRCGTGCQRLHRRIAVVEQVAVSPVGIQGQRAVLASHAATDTAYWGHCGRTADNTGHIEYGAVVDIAVIEQDIAGCCTGRVLDNRIGIGLEHRGIIATGDHDGQRCIDKFPAPIGHRIDKGVRDGFPGLEGLDRRQRVIQHIAVAAIGIEGKQAEITGVGTTNGTGSNCRVWTADLGHIQRIAIRIGIDGTGHRTACPAAGHTQTGDDVAAGPPLVFGNRIIVIEGTGRIVRAVDREGKGCGAGPALAVTEGIGEGLGQPTAAWQAGNCRVGLVDVIGKLAVTAENQGPVGSRGISANRPRRPSAVGDRGNRQRRRSIWIAVVGHHAATDRDTPRRTGRIHGIEVIIDRQRHIIAAADRNGQGGCRAAAMPIGDSVRKGLIDRLAGTQGLHGSRSCIQCVAVAAIGIQRQAAVVACQRRARCPGLSARTDHAAHHQAVAGIRITVGAAGIGRGYPGPGRAAARKNIATGGRLIFRHAVAVGLRHRIIIATTQGDGDGRGIRPAMTIADRVIEDVVGCLPLRQGLGGRSIRSVTVAAIGIHPETAIDPDNRRGHVPGHPVHRADNQTVAGIRVAVIAQGQPGDCRAVRRPAGAVIHGIGLIVAAVDGDREIGAGRAALAIGDGIGENIRQCLADRQCIDRGMGIVQGIGVAAVGLQQ